MEKSVYVFGAGFTKAFVPASPLLVDDYGIAQLYEKFKNFEIAGSLLKQALDGLLPEKVSKPKVTLNPIG